MALKGVGGRVLPREFPERNISLPLRMLGEVVEGAAIGTAGWPRSRDGVTAGVCGRDRSYETCGAGGPVV